MLKQKSVRYKDRGEKKMKRRINGKERKKQLVGGE